MKLKKKLKVYIAGPMRGYKDFNFPAFDAAARKLRRMGFECFNPADKDREKYGSNVNKSKTGNLEEAEKRGFSLREALAADTQYICLEADAIAMLPGWESSPGAKAEHALAVALGHKVMYMVTN